MICSLCGRPVDQHLYGEVKFHSTLWWDESIEAVICDSCYHGRILPMFMASKFYTHEIQIVNNDRLVDLHDGKTISTS